MFERQSNVFIIPEIAHSDTLRPGRYSLRGPVIPDETGQEIIMLGLGGVGDDTPKGGLAVAVSQEPGKRVVTIARAEGQGLLQVKSLEMNVPPDEVPYVFAQAVGSVALVQTVGQQWELPLDDVVIANSNGLGNFLNIVAQFSTMDRAA